MRLWHAALFVLVACGGKIASEGTFADDEDGPVKKGSPPRDDDAPSTSPSSPGSASSSGYHGTSGWTSSGYSSSSSSGNDGWPYPWQDAGAAPRCADVDVACGGTSESVNCYVGNWPTMKCWTDRESTKEKHMTCSCGGTDKAFKLPLAPYDAKRVVAAWQKYCGGVCF